MNKKAILITGGAGGLGKIFAQHLAQPSEGIKLILTGRSTISKEKKPRYNTKKHIPIHELILNSLTFSSCFY